MRPAPLTPSSDVTGPIPESSTARARAVHAALDSLGEEQRRMERLGFEQPLARCHEELRYWRFVAALLELPPRPPTTPDGRVP